MTNMNYAELPGEHQAQPIASRLAAEEYQINRSALEQLYEDGADILGEIRYLLLWRLSQLERICTALARCSQSQPASPAEAACLRRSVADLTVRAVQLRQELRVLLDAYQRHPPQRPSKRVHSDRPSRRLVPVA